MLPAAIRNFECVLRARRQRNANAADVLETSLALTSAVLEPERLSTTNEVIADIPVVRGGRELRNIAVVSNGRRGVVHTSS
jgi:hypothetical protein